jgi:Uma2 family endonuclease
MSSAAWPDHLLTLAEWEAMPADTTHRLELVEGLLLVAPSPVGNHQHTMVEFVHAMNRQLPAAGLFAMGDVEVVIKADFPPTVRVPDLIVVPQPVAKPNPPRYQAADVLLALEIMSPGSGAVDRVHKFAEYAEAGIADYWIVDLNPPLSVTGYHLVDGDYELNFETSRVIEVGSPAPLRIDLNAFIPFP